MYVGKAAASSEDPDQGGDGVCDQERVELEFGIWFWHAGVFWERVLLNIDHDHNFGIDDDAAVETERRREELCRAGQRRRDDCR